MGPPKMPNRFFRIIPALLIMLSSAAILPAQSFAASPAARSGEQRAVARKALQIVAPIHGTWSAMPGSIVSGLMTPGALIGNGSVGVAIGGVPSKQEIYFGRNDFWSVLRGRIMPVGRLELTVPALRDAAAQLRENIAPADVTANFSSSTTALHWRAWVANGANLFAMELTNRGNRSITLSADLLDGFGHADRTTLSGTADHVRWLRVSPETVHAKIGGVQQGVEPSAGVTIRSVRIFSSAAPHHHKPLYAWNSIPALDNAGALRTFSCGNIIMPLRAFTVHATVRLLHANSNRIIFSALANHRWMKHDVAPTDPLGNLQHQRPRDQGADAGFLLFLANGSLTANLNGTILTANISLPLHKWMNLAATYNGQRLVLLLNGQPIGETSNFPGAAQVMGSRWQWAAAHTGDMRVPYDGIGPNGVLAMRIIGARTSASNGSMRFSIPAKGHVTLLVTVADNRDSPHYFESSITALNRASFSTVAAAWSIHLAWWRQFWSKSYIEIPDKKLQSWWYGSLYVLASCSQPGNVAPGLWGNWTTSTDMGWQDDYTLDYNYEAPFWAAYPTNHVSLADPYDAPLLAWIKRGQGLARRMHQRGILYYAHLAPSPGWSADNFRSLDQKSDALFAAVDCIQRWRYTHSSAYARKVWPLLTGVADYWDHTLKLVNGRYVDNNDAPDEHLWGSAHDVNPATTIGFLRMLYPALMEMSRQLHTDQTLRPEWQHILSHLSPLPIAPANSVAAIRHAIGRPVPPSQMVILQSQHGMQWVSLSAGDRFSSNPPVKPSGSSPGMDSLQVVFPAWNIGLESSSALRKAAVNTVNYMRLWYDKNDTSSFYPAAADAGYNPQSILRHLHLLITHIGYPNFAFAMPAGGIENQATVPTTIAAMLLQSYQKNIHVFPDWPRQQNASFGNLLAVGDFLVASKLTHGQISYVRITSQRGGICNFANPWGKHSVQLRIVGKKSRLLRGQVFRITTYPGEHISLRPLSQSPSH